MQQLISKTQIQQRWLRSLSLIKLKIISVTVVFFTFVILTRTPKSNCNIIVQKCTFPLNTKWEFKYLSATKYSKWILIWYCRLLPFCMFESMYREYVRFFFLNLFFSFSISQTPERNLPHISLWNCQIVRKKWSSSLTRKPIHIRRNRGTRSLAISL